MSTGSGYPERPVGDDGTFADVLNGFTLDSGRGRRKQRRKDKDSGQQGSSQEPTDQGDRVTSVVSPPDTGGLFDPAPQEYADYASYAEYPASAQDDLLHPAEETAIVRPYALTGGRTKANHALELETLVSAKEEVAVGVFSDAAMQQIESLSIMEECRTPRSVAEIAAAMRIPLGVARVLISDAADAGLVTVHKTLSGNDGAEAHLVLMERVLSGLRRL
ncbi:Protein of unknown function [Amycolatopsis xylanica]|uniref:DUF742 domain-containing protein n=1 Tax=Amycolatopsis xylanica TaxID=589385 RepID=A0A1H3IJ38_9PSEU|nr:DUF742 domain-containing protein [Amycolatopsis xylanica]SDY27863.1 Protein of unknown function [Amycolatopsis xylanica]